MFNSSFIHLQLDLVIYYNNLLLLYIHKTETWVGRLTPKVVFLIILPEMSVCWAGIWLKFTTPNGGGAPLQCVGMDAETKPTEHSSNSAGEKLFSMACESKQDPGQEVFVKFPEAQRVVYPSVIASQFDKNQTTMQFLIKVKGSAENDFPKSRQDSFTSTTCRKSRCIPQKFSRKI